MSDLVDFAKHVKNNWPARSVIRIRSGSLNVQALGCLHTQTQWEVHIMAKANSKRNGSVPAGGYIRMSSDKQEASPDQQREIKKFAAR